MDNTAPRATEDGHPVVPSVTGPGVPGPRIGPWQLSGPLHRGSLGLIGLGRDGQGRAAWVREVDPVLLVLPGAPERLRAAAIALARRPLADAVALIDLLGSDDRLFTVSAAVEGGRLIAVDEVLGRIEPRPGAPEPLGRLVRLGRMLLGLHAGGIPEALDGDAVIEADGRLLALEPGAVAATLGREPDPAGDVRIWAGALRVLRASVPHAEQLARALEERPDDATLLAVLDQLGAPAATAPVPVAGPPAPGGVSVGRPELAAGAHRSQTSAGATAALRPPPPSARAAATQLLPGGAGAARPTAPAASPPAAAETRVLAQPGGAGSDPARTQVLPGQGGDPFSTNRRLPTATAVLGPPRQLSDAAPAAVPPWQEIPPRRGARRSRRTAAVAVLAGLGGAAVALLAWTATHRGSDPAAPSLTVSGVTVVAQPSAAGCDSTVVVTGTVVTSGAGSLHYRWTRSDGVDAGDETVRVTADQHRVTAVLRWSLSGSGTLDGVATLTVLDPGGTAPAQARFHYECA